MVKVPVLPVAVADALELARDSSCMIDQIAELLEAALAAESELLHTGRCVAGMAPDAVEDRLVWLDTLT